MDLMFIMKTILRYILWLQANQINHGKLAVKWYMTQQQTALLVYIGIGRKPAQKINERYARFTAIMISQLMYASMRSRWAI